MIKNFISYIQGRQSVKIDIDEEILKVKEILEKYQHEELIVDDDLLQYLCDTAKVSHCACKTPELPIITCHIISNLALNEDHALFMINCGIIRSLTNLLKVFKGKDKLIWKCTSAIWNLCRPVDIEQHIPDELPQLIFECLDASRTFPKSVHTCFGALSNLALVKPDETAEIFTEKVLIIMSNIVYEFKDVSMITGHFGAMVANISVNSTVANKFVENDLIRILIECLKQTDERSSVKHIVAAIHNLSDIPLFCYFLCDCQGVEVLRNIQNEFGEDISDFVVGVFELASLPTGATTSLQVAVMCCDLTTTIEILKQNGGLEIKTLENKTALDLAIENNKYEIVRFLLATGAKFDQKCFVAKGEEGEIMSRYICMGRALRFQSTQALTEIMHSSHPKLNKDVASIVTNCIPGVDLLLVLD